MKEGCKPIGGCVLLLNSYLSIWVREKSDLIAERMRANSVQKQMQVCVKSLKDAYMCVWCMCVRVMGHGGGKAGADGELTAPCC